MEDATATIAVALIDKLTATQVLIVLAILFATFLHRNYLSHQNRKMKLRNFVRAEIDGTIYEFNANIERIEADELEKKLLRMRFEFLARTYLTDAVMSMLLKNGFCKYSESELEAYCRDTGTHIRKELLRRICTFKHEFPNLIKINKEERFKTQMAIDQYTRCAKFYIRLYKPWWKRKIL